MRLSAFCQSLLLYWFEIAAQGDAGEFSYPSGIAVAGDGTVYVSDNPSRVQHFNATGGFLGTWGNYGAGEGRVPEGQGKGLLRRRLAASCSSYPDCNLPEVPNLREVETVGG